MRCIRYVSGVTVAMALLVGCSGPTPMEEMSKMDSCNLNLLVSKGIAPKWVNHKGAAFSGDKQVFYGVGCQAKIEMSSFSQCRNVRFMVAPSGPVLFAPAAGVCATDGPASA